jgi:hypothetical protein
MLLGDPPFANREIGPRDIASLTTAVPCLYKRRSPTSDSQGSTLGHRAFIYRDIATGDANHSTLQTPNTEVPSPRYNATCPRLCLRVPRGYDDFGSSLIASLRRKVPSPWKPRTPNSRYTGFVPPVSVLINGSDQLGESRLAILACMCFLHSPTPKLRYAMANGSCLHLRV